MLPKNQSRAMLLGLIAVACWATVATAFKLALTGLTPRQLVTIASLVSVIVFAVVITRNRQWNAAMKALRHSPGRYVLLGLLNPAIYYWVLFMAYDALPAQQAQAINYSWAMAYSLLAIPVLGQKLSPRELCALGIAYSGVVVIATGGNWSLADSNWAGIGLALVSTLLWAGYWLINTRNTDAPSHALLWCFVIGLLALLVAELMWPQQWPHWREPAYLAAIYVGIFEMGLTFLLWLSALRLAVSSAKVSALIFLSPVASLGLIYLVLGEAIQITTLLGLGAILFGLYLQRQQS